MNTVIEIIDSELAESEALSMALQRLGIHQHLARATIFVQPRVPLDAPDYKHPGWLEYILKLTYDTACTMTIGMIQRRPGEPFEFHS